MTTTAAARERISRIEKLPFVAAGAPDAGPIGGFFGGVRDVLTHRALLDLLIRRELKARYKDSSLGFVWSFIRPLTMLLIYYVAIGQFLGAARSVPQYAVFVYSGLTIWGLYNEIIQAGTSSILSNAGLIKKVYVPRELFPLAAVGSALFNFGIQMIVLLGAIVVTGQFPLSWNLLYALAAIIIVVTFGVAFALFLSAWNVYLRDIQYLVEVALLILFWASPIVYSWTQVQTIGATHPWISFVYLLNPMSDAILAFQRGMWEAGSHSNVLGLNADGSKHVVPAIDWPAHLDERLAILFVIGLVLVYIAQRVFARLQGNFAQEI
ncbi:ABC transporter permease [Frondihabitans australicus]|uniref:Transport permease protein n=1 Tax=Frondihabitans australicus TaxID=386892 RepID=A0A495IBE7_9MICO|nr:ABC transporter permease [Frondihabitans australicus]RKR73249.1 ABC-2 type transport system permease protein [Frondihabitans australicus]